MDIIAAIDTAVGCQQCGKPLDNSPSGDFCGEECQQRWHANRVAPAPSVESLVTRPTSRLHHGAMTLSAATIYRSGRDGRWIEMGLTGPVEIQVHYEIQEDGRLVDNTAFIRERQRNTNEMLRTWTGEGWWPTP